MSNIITSLLRLHNLDMGHTAKSIILLMGDLASDDGSGIWASKTTIAEQLETTDRTVRRAVEKLIERGFLSQTGTRKCPNGFTVEYKINVEQVEKCPKRGIQKTANTGQTATPDTVSPLTDCHPTPDTVSPQDRTECPVNHPITIHEPLEANASLSSGDDLNSEPDEIQIAVDQFNHAAEVSGWPTIRILSKSRRSALAARLRECGGLEGWAVALAKAQASPHCCGQNDRGWVANFDFITRQSSFAKLMEGNYDNRNRNNRPQQRGPSGYGSGTVDAFAEVARRRAQANA